MATIVILIFVLGYAAIAFEHIIKINKSAVALITGVVCWSVYILMSADKVGIAGELERHLGDLSAIIFFLMGAMTIVELMDAHDGFDIITTSIQQKDQRKLLWIVGFITFFLSSVLDNLTTTIVMVSLLRKLIRNDKDRLFFTGIVVIAANAGGAWTPIGDVTTTMLWMGEQITTQNIMIKLFIPSMLCLLVPLIFLSFVIKGSVERANTKAGRNSTLSYKHKAIVFYSGISVLVLVPVFKTFTHLPPYMGILLGLGILWVITELMHSRKSDEEKHSLSVVQALHKIDTPSILFFLGILICIAALQSTGVLTSVANWMAVTIKNESVIVISIGLLSSIVDNVPLVAAAQGMYDLVQYPTDHYFWEFLAYCAGYRRKYSHHWFCSWCCSYGNGKNQFFSGYLRKISLLALLGYFAGVFAYILENYFIE